MIPGQEAKLPVVTAIGEILWDVFPTGARFGGAPANFACSVAGIAGERVQSVMVSAVGADELGSQAISELSSRRVNTRFVERSDKPTGRVDIELDASGSASYQFAQDSAWDNLHWSTALHDLARRADVVCFGTLGQRSDRSRETIQKFVAATSGECLRLFDVNLRPPFYSETDILSSLELANVLKLNDEELRLLAELCKLSGTEVELLQGLAAKFQLQTVALTRGARGAVIVQGKRVDDCPGIETNVVDTVGAGDAFSATLAIGLLEGKDLADINQLACEIASFLCSQAGATPSIPRRLANPPASSAE